MVNYARVLLLGVVGIVACSKQNVPNDVSTPLTISDPNDFLRFLNPQVSLPVGDYTIVVATAAAGQTGPYTLTITRDDGSVQTITGNWASSGGQSLSGNPTVPLEMTTPGGVTLALSSSTADPYLYLVNNNKPATAIASDNNSGGGTTALISLPASKIVASEYAQAYYATIDSINAKDTLDKWKAANGFNNNDAVHVVFRDVRDLGYGRNMYVRRDSVAGDVAAYVENYQVTAVPGQNYTALNLDAAIATDARWHVGTNAIEYSNGPAGTKIVKYYTFSPTGERLLMSNIDGRGFKAMPGPCITCHGGRADPLQQNAAGSWVFPRKGNTWGRMQGIEVGAVDFSSKPGYTRTEQEAALKQINRMVLCTYPLSAASSLTEDACRTTPVAGEWTGNAGAELIKSWYGGTFNPAPLTGTNIPNATFADAYVPNGWKPNGTTIPIGADTLYRDVFVNGCRACHALRGTDNQNDVDFTNYVTTLDATNGYNERIRRHVFERGKMPLSLLVFNAFWGSGNGPGTRPSALATWLTTTGFAPATDSAGNPLQPGRPVADPGPNRTTTSPVKLSAAASRFANTYQWSVVSPSAGWTLTNANTSRPTLTTSVDGAYTLQLIVGNGVTQSAPVNVVITTQTGGWAVTPSAIRFSDIRAILQSPWGAWTTYGGTNGAGCTGCHTSGGTQPVLYYDYDRVGNGTATPATDPANLHQFYLDVRARVNFADPADSLILRKPTGNHHGGSTVNGFGASPPAAPDGFRYYNIFLEWIMNGAPE